MLVALFAVSCGDPVPPLDAAPQGRLVAVWDPLACGDSHRVVLELEDFDGAGVSRSVPCELGGITLDVVHWGVYRGRIYAWTPTTNAYSIVAVRIDIDAEVVYWNVETPR